MDYKALNTDFVALVNRSTEIRWTGLRGKIPVSCEVYTIYIDDKALQLRKVLKLSVSFFPKDGSRTRHPRHRLVSRCVSEIGGYDPVKNCWGDKFYDSGRTFTECDGESYAEAFDFVERIRALIDSREFKNESPHTQYAAFYRKQRAA